MATIIPPGEANAERFDDLVAPASRKGQQEVEDVFRFFTSDDFKAEKLRRTATDREHVNFLFCLVFQAKEIKPSGMITDLKSKFVTVKWKSQDTLDQQRTAILKKIEDAGFVTESVFSSLGDQIIVKVGCNDDRLLNEAELSEYKLELSEESLQHVLELKIQQIDPDAKVDKPKKPTYLGYLNYTEEEFRRIQQRGGEDALPFFRIRDRKSRTLTDAPISLETARNTFKNQCRADPFQHIHLKYDPEWEEQIVKDHRVQIYRTYRDGTILRTADRIFLVQSALARENAIKNGTKGAGLNLKLLQFEGQIQAFYPIQYSSQIRKAKDLSAEEIYQKFKVSFFGFKVFVPYSQPIQDIRDYCGEKIAYYFAFLEFYSLWLVFSAIVGLIVFFVQLSQIKQNFGDSDIIGNASRVKEFFVLQEAFFNGIANPSDADIKEFVEQQPLASERTEFAISVDRSSFLIMVSPSEIPILIAVYAVAIALWGAFFLEFWKRRQATLAFKWGVSDFERTAQVRPEFISNYDVPDAVTGLPTPYRSLFRFGVRLTLSITLVCTLVVLTVAAFAATYVFKAFMSQSDALDPAVAVQVALVLNALVIFFLGSVFKGIGTKLTDWENHRTDIEYEDQLIGKIFVFCFFNSYTTLTYFAFIKSGTSIVGQEQYCVADLEDFEFSSDPEEIDNAAKQRYLSQELFKIDTCYGALGYSLIIVFATQIIMNNLQEVGIPMLTNFVKKYFNAKALKKTSQLGGLGAGLKNFGGNLIGTPGGEQKADDPEEVKVRSTLPLKSPAETQFLMAPYSTPFSDYLELALQFGYVTLFVAAFPLAPLFALLNNFIEVWVDASKVCLLSRRPLVQRAQDIGTWLKIFEVLSYIAIITNAAVLCFTSVDLMPLGVENPENRVWAFLALIISVFAVKYVTDFFISDTPVAIDVMLKRQEFYEQQLFFDAEDETDKLIVRIEKKNEGGEGDEKTELLSLLQRFEPLVSDPYMGDIVREVRTHMNSAGITKEKLFGMIDTNNSDFINLSELQRALLREDIGIGAKVERPVIQLFVSALDMDGDGNISREELSYFLDNDNNDL